MDSTIIWTIIKIIVTTSLALCVLRKRMNGKKQRCRRRRQRDIKNCHQDILRSVRRKTETKKNEQKCHIVICNFGSEQILGFSSLCVSLPFVCSIVVLWWWNWRAAAALKRALHVSYFSCLFLSFSSSTTRCLIVVSAKRMKICSNVCFTPKKMRRNWPRRVSARRSQRSDTRLTQVHSRCTRQSFYHFLLFFFLFLFSFLRARYRFPYRLGSIALDVFEHETGDFANDQPRIMVCVCISRLNSSGK